MCRPLLERVNFKCQKKLDRIRYKDYYYVMTRQEILKRYKKRRQKVVKWRDENEMTFDAIAEKLGVTRPRVIQMYYFEKRLERA